MIRDLQKNYDLVSGQIASDLMLTDGICCNINAPSIPRNKCHLDPLEQL